MIRKINEKARRALKTSLILGGAMLFVAAVGGCDELGVVQGADDPGEAVMAKADVRSGINIHGYGWGWWW